MDPMERHIRVLATIRTSLYEKEMALQALDRTMETLEYTEVQAYIIMARADLGGSANSLDKAIQELTAIQAKD